MFFIRNLALISASLMVCAMLPASAVAAVCSSASVRAPLPQRDGLLQAVSPQLVSGPMLLNFQGSPLGVGDLEAISVDRVLARIRQQNCVVDDYADYVPKTKFDNTPYRFNMNSGKKFTSEEFDAWMKSRGVRIATGNKQAEPAESAQQANATPALDPAVAPTTDPTNTTPAVSNE